MISVSELFKLSLGNNGAILTNSKYYRMFFYFSIAMAISVIFLNRVFIESFGINGAALATVLVVIFFGFVKVFYVNNKLKMNPYSVNTGKIMILITLLFFVFYYVNLPINPFLGIVIKSLLISLIYFFVVIKLRLSEDLNQLYQKYLVK